MRLYKVEQTVLLGLVECSHPGWVILKAIWMLSSPCRLYCRQDGVESRQDAIRALVMPT